MPPEKTKSHRKYKNTNINTVRQIELSSEKKTFLEQTPKKKGKKFAHKLKFMDIFVQWFCPSAQFYACLDKAKKIFFFWTMPEKPQKRDKINWQKF